MGKAGKLDLEKIELKWMKYWKEQGIYKWDPNAEGEVYSIDTPPPTVSGKMHLGHSFAYSQQDFIARYRRMRGWNVFHPFGYDDNGLATERFVEQEKGVKAKDFSRQEFIKICLETSEKAEKWLYDDFSRLGMSVDWESCYRTIDERSRKISQLSFIDIYKKGRAYRKEAPTMWCPVCETAIAQAELEDKELEAEFSDVVFKLENGKDLVIATTRPELLPACVAIFVHPDDTRYKNIVGKKAKVPLFDLWVPIMKDHRADPGKGTGVVMCCTFGDQTDMEWYKAHNLPLRIALTSNGKLNELAVSYKGMRVKQARKKIIEDLKKAGLLVRQKKIVHAVNVHERCKAEIEFLVTKQWFIRYLDLEDDFIVKAEQINWRPKHFKARYDNWIKGLQWDWCISRQRYYGVAFPVWYCKKCGEVKLAEASQLPVDPLQDKPKGKCKCGSNEFVPEKDVLDTWATSSLTPQINCLWGIDEKFFKKMFPMGLRPQGHDIISLWLFNTVVKGLLHHNKLPWKNIVINGWALDPKGKKMSKSLGNVIHPQDMIDKYSADILRYWAGQTTLGEDVPLKEKEFVAGQKFVVKLYNAMKFVSKLSEGFDYRKANRKKLKFTASDKWVLSRINKVKKGATRAFENYEFSKVLAATRNFFWLEFADFYIEEVKYRVYNKGDETKDAAIYTLVSVALDCLKLTAPFMPYITEEVYQTLMSSFVEKKSIHLERWPEAEEEMIDEDAERVGVLANDVIAAARKQKSEQALSLGAEITTLVIKCSAEDSKRIEKAVDVIKGTIRAKEIEIVESGVGGLEVELKL